MSRKVSAAGPPEREARRTTKSRQTLKQRKALGTGSAKKAASRSTGAKPAASGRPMVWGDIVSFEAAVQWHLEGTNAVYRAYRARIEEQESRYAAVRRLNEDMRNNLAYEPAGKAEALPEAKPRQSLWHRIKAWLA